MAESGWALLWNDFDIDGYTDYFPPGSLAFPSRRLVHLVVGPRGWRGFAACSVQVDGRRTRLDYDAFANENVRAGMDVGLMTVVFDRNRKNVDRVEWKYPGKRNRRVDVTGAVSTPPDPGPYLPRRGKLRKPITVTARGAQGRFRIAARAAYGDKCAISGCDISEALEAVHIDPYANASQHHPRNALLLRRDLHVLFDLSLIAVNPKTLLVHVAPQLKRNKEYGGYDKRKKLGAPVASYETHRPEPKALERRWKHFLSKTGPNRK